MKSGGIRSSFVFWGSRLTLMLYVIANSIIRIAMDYETNEMLLSRPSTMDKLIELASNNV